MRADLADVVEEAFVPLLKLTIWRFPLTPPAPDDPRLIVGSLAAFSVPLEMLAAFVASIVADGAGESPPMVETVVAQLPATLVTSPEKAGSCAQARVPVSFEAASATSQGGFEYDPFATRMFATGIVLSMPLPLASIESRSPDVSVPDPWRSFPEFP